MADESSFYPLGILARANLHIYACQAGATQRTTLYRCVMLCCGAVVTLSHVQLALRERVGVKGRFCRACQPQRHHTHTISVGQLWPRPSGGRDG